MQSLFRAAATEYLFQEVSPHVIQEARQQIGIVFATNHGVVPENLITVHIPWRDQYRETDFPPIEEYIHAIHNLTTATNTLKRLETIKTNKYLLGNRGPQSLRDVYVGKTKRVDCVFHNPFVRNQ